MVVGKPVTSGQYLAECVTAVSSRPPTAKTPVVPHQVMVVVVRDGLAHYGQAGKEGPLRIGSLKGA